MNPENQNPGECDYCHLLRLKILAQKAGLNLTVSSVRIGKHRRLQGFEVKVEGTTIKQLKNKPSCCTCKA